ncbi:MAG: hypothetical protein KJ702_16135 [Gammaproteobacteria bacterium]|nr:hypothetical protein [Gammaproteobacteria bacterium]
MAEQATASSVSASPLSLAALSNLDARQKMGAAVAIALAIAILVGAWLWTKEPPYGVLFSNLNDQDGGQIVTSLQQQNIPYKFSASGGAIMVPSSMVHDARLRLASQGLPKGGLVGFEVMENQKLGISQFAEQINYQRGLEGELARLAKILGKFETKGEKREHSAFLGAPGCLRVCFSDNGTVDEGHSIASTTGSDLKFTV